MKIMRLTNPEYDQDLPPEDSNGVQFLWVRHEDIEMIYEAGPHTSVMLGKYGRIQVVESADDIANTLRRDV